MPNKLKTKGSRVMLCLLVALFFMTSYMPLAHAAKEFNIADLSNAVNFDGYGTFDNPITIAYLEELVACHVIKFNSGPGTLWYTTPYEDAIDLTKIHTAYRVLVPFACRIGSGTRDGVHFITIQYQVPEYVDAALIEAERIVSNIITPDMGYLEKLRVINDYIVKNISYDYLGLAEGPATYDNPIYNAYGALMNDLAVCDGYASAFQLLGHAAGIPVHRIAGEVIGSTSDAGHAWNLVYLFGEFYYFDVTWNDAGAYSNDKYYMISEEEINQTRIPRYDFPDIAIKNIHNHNLYAAQALNELGLFLGTDKGFELHLGSTRNQAAVMMVRLLGAENEAKAANYPHPFTDVPAWASPHVGYLYHNKLTMGVSASEFAGGNAVTWNDYFTFMLRAMGYNDNMGDFSWAKAYEKAIDVGIFDYDPYMELDPAGLITPTAPIDRGMLAAISLHALSAKEKSGGMLIDELVAKGAVNADRRKNVDFLLTGEPYIIPWYN